MTTYDKIQRDNIPNLTGQKFNKTTMFMLSAIDLDRKKTNFKLLTYFGFVNCYLGHKQSLHNSSDYLYLVFNPSKEALKRFSSFYELYKAYPNYVTDYIIDQNVIVLVFKVKYKWIKTYQAFKKSKYSEMGREYADLFRKLEPSGNVRISNEYMIITKHKKYKEHLEKQLDVKISDDVELLDPLDLDNEVLDYEYKNKVNELCEV